MNVEMMKKNYDSLLTSCLNQEELKMADLYAIRWAYLKCHLLGDEKFAHLETRRLILFAKKHPKYQDEIMQIINEANIQKQQVVTQNIVPNLILETQQLLRSVNHVLNSNSISEESISQCVSKIRIKMNDVRSQAKKLSESQYMQLISLLSETLTRCETTVSMLKEEQEIWQI